MSRKFSPLLLASIALLSASPPFSIDMYLPALPQIAESLSTTPSAVQLTLSAFVLGLAVGQLIIGPVSDAIGRKKLLVAGAAIGLIAAVLAAMAPTIEILITARVIQGLGLGACTVIARAVIPDMASGQTATKAFAVMMSIQTLAPILAPLVGGILAEPLGWRGLFWVLAAISAVQLVAAIVVIPESRPPEMRYPLKISSVMHNYKVVLSNRKFIGYLVALTFTFATMFCYISASPFFIQEELGLSVYAFTATFALNSVGLFLGNIVNARLQDRFEARLIMRTAVISWLGFTTLLFLATLTGIGGVPTILVLLFLVVSHQGLIQSNATALGQLLVRERAGAAAALMGAFQFGGAAVIGPLMGLGSSAGMTMAIGMMVCCVVAVSATRFATRAE